MNIQILILSCIGTAIVFFLIGLLVQYLVSKYKVTGAENRSKKVVADAKREAETAKKSALVEAKEEIHKERMKAEKENQKQRRQMQESLDQFRVREQSLNKKVDVLHNKEQNISLQERQIQLKDKSITEKEGKLEEIIQLQNEGLEKIAGMSASEAKEQLVENLKEEAYKDAAQEARLIKEKATENAQNEARDVVIGAIQRCAVEHTVESTVSVVNLPSDEIKGRIIGREGRNIRSFEHATGVEVIIDDTPGAVVLSAFSPYRREIAKIALEKLIEDGRIHPARIEEMVNKATKQVEEIVKVKGEEACFEVGVHNIHPEILKLVGRLHFRTSYGQNVLLHSKEVAYLCGLMAEQLKLDPTLARRCGLLHDIGKSIDMEQEGTHAAIGYEQATKYKEHPAVINGIGSHHEDMEATSAYAVFVAVGDAISASRPGARRSTLQTFVNRVSSLEEITNSFQGVEKSFVLQAGREVRVIVQPDKVKDDIDSERLAREIAGKIKTNMVYPGQIKVVVVRETRSVEYAK